MRLLTTFTHEEASTLDPYAFTYFLNFQDIESTCEAVADPQQGVLYQIWVVDEDKVDQAEKLLKQFKENPNDPRYKKDYNTFIKEPDEEARSEPVRQKPRRFLSPVPYGKLSIFIIFLAILVFFLAQMGKQPQVKIPGANVQLPSMPIVDRWLLYDYPKLMELRDKLLQEYTPQAIAAEEPPGKEAEAILKQMNQTLIWNGLYERFVNHIKNKTVPFAYHGPLFEKIKQGQIWRLVSPIFLHYDILHIFFNLLWFILLANQIEYRIGSGRFLLFVLITAIISNTCQYLMSGPLFMGLSGVVVACAGFIFARQQTAPWEGYLLHRWTFGFLALFVFGVFFLQVVFFFLQIFGKFSTTIPIANTAHIVGGFVGYFLGKLRFFARRPLPLKD